MKNSQYFVNTVTIITAKPSFVFAVLILLRISGIHYVCNSHRFECKLSVFHPPSTHELWREVWILIVHAARMSKGRSQN